MDKEEETHEEGLIHDEVELEDFEYDTETDTLKYPCPCGDEFSVTFDELLNGGKFAKCPSCSLMVQVIFEPEDLINIIETKSWARKPFSSTNSSPVKATK